MLYPLTTTTGHLDLQLPALSPDGAVQQWYWVMRPVQAGEVLLTPGSGNTTRIVCFPFSL